MPNSPETIPMPVPARTVVRISRTLKGSLGPPAASSPEQAGIALISESRESVSMNREWGSDLVVLQHGLIGGCFATTPRQPVENEVYGQSPQYRQYQCAGGHGDSLRRRAGGRVGRFARRSGNSVCGVGERHGGCGPRLMRGTGRLAEGESSSIRNRSGIGWACSDFKTHGSGPCGRGQRCGNGGGTVGERWGNGGGTESDSAETG